MTNKHLIIHNAYGLMQVGFEMREALDMALDAEEDLFPENWKQLRLKRPGGLSGASGKAGPVQYGGGYEGGTGPG
jgi:hypothetical protein